LIVIDLQNDYFNDGAFPLWHADATLEKVEAAIAVAHADDIPVILIQHIANAPPGASPFFNAHTWGVEIHPRILKAAPNAPVIRKAFADAFCETTLAETLAQAGVDTLLICGMMTQNCVTHTALSKSADAYAVRIVADACTTTDGMIHQLALSALAVRLDTVAADTLR